MDKKLLTALKTCFELAPEEAIKFLEDQGYDISWDWKEQLDIIKQHAFTVAKVGSIDVLQTIHEELIRAAKDGTLYEEFKNTLTELFTTNGYLPANGSSAWRLDIIYRTNMQSAYMGGRYREMMGAVNDFPYWEYIAVMDSRTRPAHSALNGKIVRADDPFWSYAAVPNGYQCRCRTRALDDAYVKDHRLKISEGSSLNFTPDEGFDNNPLDNWQPDLTNYEPALAKILKGVLK